MDALEKEYFDELKDEIEETKEVLFRIAEKIGVDLENDENIEEDTKEVNDEDDEDDE